MLVHWTEGPLQTTGVPRERDEGSVQYGPHSRGGRGSGNLWSPLGERAESGGERPRFQPGQRQDPVYAPLYGQLGQAKEGVIVNARLAGQGSCLDFRGTS